MAEQPDNTTKQKCLSTFATSSKGGASAGVPKTLDEALSEIGFGPFQWRLMMVLAVGQMADAMEITLLSFLAPCVQSEWGLSSAQTSSITSVVFAGELLGSLFWGPLADRRGRRATYLASLSAILAAGLASAGAEGYAWLLAARGLVGVGVGGGCVPFDFFAEVLPQERRGRALAFLQLFWGGGSLLVAAVAAAGLEAHGWRPLVLVCCAPVALAALAAHLYLPESPRWLLAQGRDREAKQVVLEAARLNGVDLEGFILVNSLRSGQGRGGGPAGWGKATAAAGGPGAHREGEGGEEEGGFRELFADGAAWTTVPLAAVWAGIGFGYYATVLLIGTVFQKDDAAAGGCSFDEVNIMISAAAEMVALMVLHELVDNAAVGRRGAQAGLYALMAGATLVLGAAGARGGASKAATSAAFLARGAAVAGFSATWIHTPELYPTRVRTTAHSFLYSVARVAAFCSAYWAYAPRVPLPWRTALVAVLAGTCAVLALGMRETSGAALDSPAAVARRSPHTAQEAETLLPHAAAAAAVAAEEAGGQGGGGGEAGLGEGGYDSSLRGSIKVQTVVL